jgi:hypothetical protein
VEEEKTVEGGEDMDSSVPRVAALALLVGVTLISPAVWAQTRNSVTGEAYGVLAKIDAQSDTVTVNRTPTAVLRGGGMVVSRSSGIDVPGYVTTGRLTVTAAGSKDPAGSRVLSTAEVDRLNILDGLVTAERAVAVSGSAGNGVTAASNAEGSGFFGLVVNGVPFGDVTPAPNTTIEIPGGVVILNEQIPRGDGITTTALTVQMVHVVLSGDPIGDIVVLSSSTGVTFSP